MYPSGTAVTMDLECRPISIKLCENMEPSTLVMVMANPVDLQVMNHSCLNGLQTKEYFRVSP